MDIDYALHELNKVDGLEQQETNAAPTEEPSDEPTILPTEDPASPSLEMQHATLGQGNLLKSLSQP